MPQRHQGKTYCPRCFKESEVASIPFSAPSIQEINGDTLTDFPIHKLPLEVLLNILDWLGCIDLQTLLLAQRVCSFWRDAIARSPTLQRTLYFRPSEDVDDEDPGSSHGDQFNPLLARHFPNILHDMQAHERHRLPPEQRSELKSKIRPFEELLWGQHVSSRAKVLDKDASWRHMLVSRRRINKLTVLYTPAYNAHSWSQRIEFDFSTYSPIGMNMGGYYDLILKGLPVPTPSHPMWLLLPGRTSTHTEPFLDYDRLKADDIWVERLDTVCLGYEAFPYTFYYLEPSEDGAVLLSNVFRPMSFQFKRRDLRCKWQVVDGPTLPTISVARRIETGYIW